MAAKLVLPLAFTLISAACAAGELPDWRTEPPIIYVLDYGSTHVDNPDFIPTVAKAPPDLLHLGKDVPFTHNWGPIQALGGENQAHGKGDDIRRLSPAQVRERVAKLKAMVAGLHDAGVRMVMPYVCSMTMGGDEKTRAGFFEFYDHWDEYAEFDLGPRAQADPINWMQRNPDGSLNKFYKYSGPFYPPYEPNQRYACCVNNPDWRAWLENVVRWVARCGYDGTFVDNSGSQRCYCPYCQEKFDEYLAKRYTAEERRRYFGSDDPQMVNLSERAAMLLWAETQRFWKMSLHDHQVALRNAGREINPNFEVFPNGGHHRPEDVKLIYADSDYVMFEKSTGDFGTHPGMTETRIVANIRRRHFNDNIYEYKLTQCWRQRDKAIVLCRAGYPRTQDHLRPNLNTAQLGIAESAAFGSGAGYLFRPDYEKFGDVMNRNRRFFREHSDLYAGYQSYARVAAAFFPEQKLYGNSGHAKDVQFVTESLLDAHILFDYLNEEQLTPERAARYDALIVPGIRYMSRAHARTVLDRLRRGATVILAGRNAESDEHMVPYEQSPLAALSKGKRDDAAHAASGRLGSGRFYQCSAVPSADELAAMLGKRLQVAPTDPVDLRTVRFNAFLRRGDDARLVLHVVNYNVPLGKDADPPEPIADVPITLRLPDGFAPADVRVHDPQRPDAESLEFAVEDGALRLTLPEVVIYKVVEVRPH